VGPQGPVWTGADNFAPPPTGIRSPDRPARSESLYRLSYRGPNSQSRVDVEIQPRRFAQMKGTAVKEIFPFSGVYSMLLS
jgi:hypothetical protein